MSRYNLRHVSSITMLIFRRTNFIITESDDTRCCNNTICPPEDGHGNDRNMSTIVMCHIYCYRIKELCIKMVIETSLYNDSRSEKYKKIDYLYIIFRTLRFLSPVNREIFLFMNI